MNTSAKGAAFEQKVFRILSRELKEGRLLFIPAQCQIHHRKGYYSRELEKDIIVDISIEAFLPGQKTYSYLTIIECKDYTGRVPVNDIKEFRDNLRQIGAQKGIIVASGPFAEGVEKIAKSARIGLVRILPDAKLQWDLYRTTSGLVADSRLQDVGLILQSDLFSDTLSSNLGRFVGFADGQLVHTLAQLFERIFLEDRLAFPQAREVFLPLLSVAPSVELVSPKDIARRTQTLLRNQATSSWETPLYDIVAELEKSGELRLAYRENLGIDMRGCPILGSIAFNPTRIFIARRAHENPRRQRFTIAHELGHHCLGHSKYMAREYYSSSDFDSLGTDTASLEDIRRMEWQANMFASYLLLPTDGLLAELNRIFNRLDIREKGHGLLYLDRQPCNYKQFLAVTNWIMERFNVSRQVVEIAIKRLGILNDARSSPSRVSDVAQRLFANALKHPPR